MERVQDVQADCLADDIEIEAAMVDWSDGELREFFETGGVTRPAGAVSENSSSSATVRLYAISDLHWDYQKNRTWLDALPSGAHRSDAIILAGDITHVCADLESCLRRFKAIFGEVLYTPGNHELWVKRPDVGRRFADSVEKLRWILELCDTIGVRTRPTKLVGSGGGAVWVVPLLSWYEPNLDGQATAESLLSRTLMTDFHQCVWPDGKGPDDMPQVLGAMNAPSLSRSYDAPVVSFSHFLPRPELMPPRFNVGAMSFLADAAGSHVIETQLRAVGSKLHVFGHTHVNWDCEVEGTHYIQNAVRYPKERDQWKSRVDRVFEGQISRLLVWSSEDPAVFCPLAWRCKCKYGFQSRGGAPPRARP